MAEAAVHALFDIQVVERIDKVSPVEVGVDAEHLSEDSLADIDKVGWEATALTDPVAGTRELREWCGQGRRASWDRGGRAGSVEATRGVCCTGDFRAAGVLCK